MSRHRTQSQIDNALSQWMPLTECITAMYVRVGTLQAELLLLEAEKQLKAARIEHEAAKASGSKGVRVRGCEGEKKKTKKKTGAEGA